MIKDIIIKIKKRKINFYNANNIININKKITFLNDELKYKFKAKNISKNRAKSSLNIKHK